MRWNSGTAAAALMIAASAAPAAACDMHGMFGGGYYDGYGPGVAYNEPRDAGSWESNADLTKARDAFVQRFKIKAAATEAATSEAPDARTAPSATIDAN